MVKRRVQTRLERKRTGPEEWLVVTRRPLADDSTLEGQASPDATEHDARYRYRYYLTPTGVAEVELRGAVAGGTGAGDQSGRCALKPASNEARVRRGWTSTRCAPGRAGITTWRCP